MRRYNPRIGKLSGRETLTALVIVTVTIIVAIVVGIIEPALFTSIAQEYNFELNFAWIFNHFSPLCILFLIIFLAVPLPFIILALLRGNRQQIIFYGVVTLVAVSLAIFVEDLVAHLRYGSLPADDWTHWLWQSHIMLWQNFWLPTWYIFALVFAMMLFLGYAFFRKGGRRR